MTSKPKEVRGRGFCDNSSKAIFRKGATMGEEAKNCCHKNKSDKQTRNVKFVNVESFAVNYIHVKGNLM